MRLAASAGKRAGAWALAILLGVGCLPMPLYSKDKSKPTGHFEYEGKKFASREALLDHLRDKAQEEVDAIERGYFYGGSLMVNLPPDGMILTEGYLGISLRERSDETKKLLLEFCKQTAEATSAAFARAGLFDSVMIKQSSSYVRQASDLGYRYVLNFTSASELQLIDTVTGQEALVWHKTAQNKGEMALAEVVHKVERVLEKNEVAARQQPAAAKQAVAAAVPIEGMQYDEASRRGWVSIKGRGLEARGLVLRRIAEICATKNKLLISDEMNARGAFKVHDEELKDGVLKISFEALY